MQVFDRNHARTTPEPGLDPAMLWALATAKTNRAERFGVEYSLTYKPHATDARTDPHAYIQVEECYHTRILADALRTIGLTMEVMPPGFTARAMVRSMVRLPESYANVIVLCGEHTHSATGVSVEVSIAQEEGVPYFLLKGYADRTCTRPRAALESDKMYKWTWDNLKKLIAGRR